MSGDERKRFCSECGKHVYNLSAMTEGEAQKFADETEGRECVAYIRTDDGRMLAPNFIERLILRIVGWKPALASVLVAVLPTALASCVSRTTAGTSVPPGRGVVPQERKYLGKTDRGVMLGTPAPIPVPGKVLMLKK